MTPAIRVENLAKCYRVGLDQTSAGYRTLRETVTDLATAPFRRWRDKGMDRTEPFWALNDVNFEVQPGEVVGLIGRNGAGKSTLLKILSRITKPSRGRVELHGRVGSLLEVGTGFHPELTGRDNVYLNGSILGMSRREIAARFDEIVDFAEIGKFLDTPVKRYSSGMYVRLAFAVAAHLEPEILIVDEVLAVGDAVYQRRCLDRMTALARSGITVLFVSHNMEMIPRFCQRAVLLRAGRVEQVGPASSVIEGYLKGLAALEAEGDLSGSRRSGTGRAFFRNVELLGPDGNPTMAHVTGEDLVVRLHIEAEESIREVGLAVILQNVYGTKLITSWNQEVGYSVDLEQGRQVIDCRFRGVRLRPGHRVQVGLWMGGSELLDFVEEAAFLEIAQSPDTKQFSTNYDQGIVLCDHIWSRPA
jgi:lipopolysaccharide transport system ATP-binding protein